MSKMNIPLLDLVAQYEEIKPELDAAIQRVVSSGYFILGPEVKAVEEEVAAYLGVDYGIGVASGTDALLLALRALDIGPGDEVILPAYSFFATVGVILHVGATPVFVDVDAQDYCIDTAQTHAAVTDKTKAIIPVHLYGQAADMDAINKIAKENNLSVIEDNAQAQGATFKKKKTGSFGIINFTSFYPTKNIGALGDGGMITTNDPGLAEKARTLRDYGKDSNNEFNMVGINSRLDELQARLLSVKLRYLDNWNRQRIDVGTWYSELLGDIKEIQIQECLPESVNVRHIYPMISDKRDELKVYLKNKGIDTIIHYPIPIHLQKSFSFLGCNPGDYINAEMISMKELSLPIYPGLTKGDVEYICNIMKDFFRK